MANAKGNKKSSGKPASNKPAAKPAGIPSIGAAFAAQEAAALLGRKSAAATGTHKESSTFKQMKEGLNQTNLDGLGKMLDQTGGSSGKKSALPFNHNRGQTGRNQTFGADVARTGVPRRTAG